MNDRKLELAKKKALLEDIKKRKLERQQLQQQLQQQPPKYFLTASSSTTTTTTSNTNNEFSNLTSVDDILSRCGLGEFTTTANATNATNGNSSSSRTLTPSSSYSISLSSSTQSIYSTANNNNNFNNGNNRSSKHSRELSNNQNHNLIVSQQQSSHHNNNNNNSNHALNVKYEEVVSYTMTTLNDDNNSNNNNHNEAAAVTTLTSNKYSFHDQNKNESEFMVFNKAKSDKSKLSSKLNTNVVSIIPNETIKYAKETQTAATAHAGAAPISPSHTEDTDVHDHQQTSDNTKRKKKREKPLAFFDDIFVYDTLQWEDEFNPLGGHGHHDHDHQDQRRQVKSSGDVDENENSSRNQMNQLNSSSLSISTDDEADLLDAADNLKSIMRNAARNQVDMASFSNFLSVKRPIVERALRQNEPSNNIFYDYSADTKPEKTSNETADYSLNLKKCFPNPDSKDKQRQQQHASSVISCLDWSLQYPELLLCSYDQMSNNDVNYEDIAGEAVVCLWNAAHSDAKLPQQTFITSGLITSCSFSAYHPSLIIAGTYSGQILMWDIRSNKRTPIQRSSLSITAHTNPVYCSKVISTQDNQNLISISNDGRLCLWSLENLNVPYESQDLMIKPSTTATTVNKSMNAICFDIIQQQQPTTGNNRLIPSNNNNNLDSSNSSNSRNGKIVVGTEEGQIGTLSIGAGNKINVTEMFEGHSGPVTAVSCLKHHQHQSSDDDCSDQKSSFEETAAEQQQQTTTDKNNNDNKSIADESMLFLSTSFDSTIKLWSMKNNTTEPIYTFETNGDYVFDIEWSPMHPAVFASVDGSGKLDVWNLNRNIETSCARYYNEINNHPSSAIASSNSGKSLSINNQNTSNAMNISNSSNRISRLCALNKLKWSRNGTEIAIGDELGRISILEVGASFVCASAASYEDEMSSFKSTVRTLKQLSYEAKEFVSAAGKAFDSSSNYYNHLLLSDSNGNSNNQNDLNRRLNLLKLL